LTASHEPNATPRGRAAPPANRVLAGVPGCGQSTVGRKLAERLGAEFIDADAHHPPENVARMFAAVENAGDLRDAVDAIPRSSYPSHAPTP